MLIAIAIDRVRDVWKRARRRPLPRPADRDVRSMGVVRRLRSARQPPRPTIHVDGIDEIRAGLQPGDRIACTDELGCLMLVGRIDRWLALDDYVRERFIVQRGDGAGRAVSTPACPPHFVPPICLIPIADGTLPDRVLIVDVFKEYPIGNSRSWLPKSDRGRRIARHAAPRNAANARPAGFAPRTDCPELAPRSLGEGATTFTLGRAIKASDVLPGPSLRVSRSGPPARLHGHRRHHVVARHRRDHGDFQRRSGRAAPTAGVSGRQIALVKIIGFDKAEGTISESVARRFSRLPARRDDVRADGRERMGRAGHDSAAGKARPSASAA